MLDKDQLSLTPLFSQSCPKQFSTLPKKAETLEI